MVNLIYFLSVFSLLAFLLSLWGKISPRLTIIIFITAFFTYPLVSIYNDYCTKEISPSISTGIMSEQNEEEKQSEKPDRIMLPKLDYQTAGFWEWDNSFKKVLEKSGWREVKTAKNIIDISYSKNLEQDATGAVLQYVYNKGYLQIMLNDKLCCCEKIMLPEKISTHSLRETNGILQKHISTLVEQHEVLILEQFYQCTKKFKH